MVARLVPAAQIHHSDARLIMFLDRFQRRRSLFGHALLGDAKVHLSTVGELLARPGDRFFQQFLCLGVLLLMKMLNRLLIQLKLLFELRIHHLPHRFGMRRSCTNTLIFQRLMFLGSAARFSFTGTLCRLPGASHFGESSRAYLPSQRNRIAARRTPKSQPLSSTEHSYLDLAPLSGTNTDAIGAGNGSETSIFLAESGILSALATSWATCQSCVSVSAPLKAGIPDSRIPLAAFQ